MCRKFTNVTPIWKIELSTALIFDFLFYFYILSGDIGGQMGLFIGASVLTILEIFDYLYEVCCVLACLIYPFFCCNVFMVTNNLLTVYFTNAAPFCRFLRTRCWDIFYARDGHIGALVTIW